MIHPARGDVWFADLRPTRGREQDGDRPVLVLSVDRFNRGPAGLVIVAPVTRTDRDIAAHVRIEVGVGGLREPGFIMCEQVRSIANERLRRRSGDVDDATMGAVSFRVRALMGL